MLKTNIKHLCKKVISYRKKKGRRKNFFANGTEQYCIFLYFCTYTTFDYNQKGKVIQLKSCNIWKKRTLDKNEKVASKVVCECLVISRNDIRSMGNIFFFIKKIFIKFFIMRCQKLILNEHCIHVEIFWQNQFSLKNANPY